MKNKKVFIKAFGFNEFGQIDFPKKISNIKIARLEWGNIMGCAYCFPHGIETQNATILKNRKNWKNKREKQFRSSSKRISYNKSGFQKSK